ncbi:MAG: nucleotidyltransferase family protein [Desulfobacterales bacterium]|nr:nucleotidyltransferase family protein [Desulfobacterales bacterium]
MLDELQEKRDKILLLANKYGAKNVRVFGSFARGEYRHDSDIDFLADMEGSLLKRIALTQDLEKLLGRKVDVVTEKSIHWYIREKVINEAVPL